MVDDGTTFEIDLPVTGKERIDAASLSLDVLAAKLDSAKLAVSSTSAAVKAGESSYRSTEASANAVSKALERIGLKADEQGAKLAKAQAAGDEKGANRAAVALERLAERHAEVAEKSDVLKAKMLAEAAALDKLKGIADKASDAHSKLAKATEQKKKGPAESEDPEYERIARGLRKIGGPVAEAGEKVANLGSAFGKLRSGLGSTSGAILGATALTVALAVAALAAAAAVAELTVKTALWAIGLADANRQSSLLAQGMAQSVKGGIALNAEVKALARVLPLSNEELSSMAKGFAQAGYRGQDLSNALKASATWAARLKFGPDFAKEMLSLDEQSKILHANLAATFGGLKIEGLLEALQKMIALLDDSTESGQAIKVVFESFFQPMIDGAVDAQYKVERFFLNLEILALRALISIKPYGSEIKTVVEVLIAGAAAIVAVVVVAFGLLAAAALAVVAAFGLLVAAGYGLTNELLSFASVGKDMVLGIAKGITDAGGAVWDALKGVVSGAVDSVEKFLGIHSPSLVFAEIGMQTGAGMAQGVDRSAPGVQDAYSGLVAPPAPPSGATGSTSSGSSVSGVKLENVQFIFNGVQGAEEAESRFSTLLTRLLEGDAAQLGAMQTTPAPA
jgi:hypothetical protein